MFLSVSSDHVTCKEPKSLVYLKKSNIPDSLAYFVGSVTQCGSWPPTPVSTTPPDSGSSPSSHWYRGSSSLTGLHRSSGTLELRSVSCFHGMVFSHSLHVSEPMKSRNFTFSHNVSTVYQIFNFEVFLVLQLLSPYESVPESTQLKSVKIVSLSTHFLSLLLPLPLPFFFS